MSMLPWKQFIWDPIMQYNYVEMELSNLGSV